MARPVKWRQIQNMPEIMNFSPTNNIDEAQERNVLKMEELEAIRLKDLEGLDQNECAALMEISRPTFRRILLSARIKIADSLVNGKAVSFDGGNYICEPEHRGGRGRDLGQGRNRGASGRGNGAGRGMGQGHGMGQGRGLGAGNGQGRGMGLGINQEVNQESNQDNNQDDGVQETNINEAED